MTAEEALAKAAEIAARMADKYGVKVNADVSIRANCGPYSSPFGVHINMNEKPFVSSYGFASTWEEALAKAETDANTEFGKALTEKAEREEFAAWRAMKRAEAVPA
jgi:hypothetical protein